MVVPNPAGDVAMVYSGEATACYPPDIPPVSLPEKKFGLSSGIDPPSTHSLYRRSILRFSAWLARIIQRIVATIASTAPAVSTAFSTPMVQPIA